jgi:hypothetical protein
MSFQPSLRLGNVSNCALIPNRLLSRFIEELKARRDNTAAVNRALSPSQLLDAASAFELLSDYPTATLSEAARIYLDVIKTRIASITLEKLFERFKAAKKHKSRFYLRDIKWVSDRLSPLHPKLVSDITRPELAALLGPLPDSSRNNMLRTLRALFRYGHDLGYLKEIPIRRNDFRRSSEPRLTCCRSAKCAGCLKWCLTTIPSCFRYF